MTRACSTAPDILQAVRAAFIVKGETLAAWCRENNVDHSWAWRVLRGHHSGPASDALWERVTRSAFSGARAA